MSHGLAEGHLEPFPAHQVRSLGHASLRTIRPSQGTRTAGTGPSQSSHSWEWSPSEKRGQGLRWALLNSVLDGPEDKKVTNTPLTNTPFGAITLLLLLHLVSVCKLTLCNFTDDVKTFWFQFVNSLYATVLTMSKHFGFSS